MNLFIIKDKSNRKIRLTKERWKHIVNEHPEIQDFEEIKEVLTNPLRIKPSKFNPDFVQYYYKFKKENKRYLMVVVKYLNGEGFIITAYFMRNIK